MRVSAFVLANLISISVYAQSGGGLAPQTPETQVTVNITNIRNQSGRLFISLYDHPDHFPSKGEKAVVSKIVDVSGNEMKIDFGKIKSGTYAISFMHDENNDGKMNFNFVGIPKEGFGFSNDPTITFGPPSFKRASIEIKDANVLINMKAKYF